MCIRDRLSFVRTNLTIAELQPFEETLADAISISGAYGIPAVLVPVSYTHLLQKDNLNS